MPQSIWIIVFYADFSLYNSIVRVNWSYIVSRIVQYSRYSFLFSSQEKNHFIHKSFAVTLGTRYIDQVESLKSIKFKFKFSVFFVNSFWKLKLRAQIYGGLSQFPLPQKRIIVLLTTMVFSQTCSVPPVN